MDICTLIVVTSMNALACYSKNICTDLPNEAGRIFCAGVQQIACPETTAFYDCVRPDGSKYTITKPRG